MGACLSAKKSGNGADLDGLHKDKAGAGYPGKNGHSEVTAPSPRGKKQAADQPGNEKKSTAAKPKRASNSGSSKARETEEDAQVKEQHSASLSRTEDAALNTVMGSERAGDGPGETGGSGGHAPVTPKGPNTPKGQLSANGGVADSAPPSLSPSSSTLASYTLNELSLATDGFNQGRKLGEGGFGSVYWGELALEDGNNRGSGRTSPVAIKILNEDGLQGHKEWLAEVTLLGTLRHPHLVRLLGWCSEGTSRLLVYEYMPNGSLDVLLHPLPGSHCDVPPWGLRMEIALGVARCLEYLHEGRDRPIIYRDLKSANVLLDHEYKAKLADFGLAKDGPVGDKTHVTTQVVGTHGYADPDYIITGHLTPKSDVYGFGVLMLELITGRHALNDEEEEGATDASGLGYEGEEEDLAEWAIPYLDDRRRIVEIVDRRIAGSVPQRGLVKAALLARQCINDSPYERPQMSSIVKTLVSIQNPYEWPGTEQS